MPPFSGQVKDGDIWGRGAIDDKGPGVIEMMAMLAIKRAGILLNRDVIFIATGDEEEGGRNGAGWIVDHEKEVFADAGYLLNEGGGIDADRRPSSLLRRFGGREDPDVAPADRPGAERARRGAPDGTAVTHLTAALGRLVAYRPPIRMIDTVRDYFHAIGKLDKRAARIPEPGDLAAQVRPIRKEFPCHSALQCAGARHRHADRARRQPEDQHDPATASAEVDCRLLPGADPKEFLDQIRQVIGDDTIKVEVLLNFPAVSSPARSILMNAINAVAWQDGHDTVGADDDRRLHRQPLFSHRRSRRLRLYADRIDHGPGACGARGQRADRSEGAGQRNPADG